MSRMKDIRDPANAGLDGSRSHPASQAIQPEESPGGGGAVGDEEGIPVTVAGWGVGDGKPA